jgi:HEAT repeat protein
MTVNETASDAQRLSQFFKLAQSHALHLRGREAAVALLELSRVLGRAPDREFAESCVAVGRRLATPEAVERLLDQTWEGALDISSSSAALRFAGPAAIDPVLRRLNASQDLASRRTYFKLAVAVAAYPEIQRPLVAKLNLLLGDARWYAVRNAIQLLAALGGSLPQERLWDLARAEHRQVRLALTHVLSKQRPSPDGLDLLTTLIEDQDPGVRYAAAVALSFYAHPRARDALSRRALLDTDPETRAACEAGLSRRAVALRSA